MIVNQNKFEKHGGGGPLSKYLSSRNKTNKCAYRVMRVKIKKIITIIYFRCLMSIQQYFMFGRVLSIQIIQIRIDEIKLPYLNGIILTKQTLKRTCWKVIQENELDITPIAHLYITQIL